MDILTEQIGADLSKVVDKIVKQYDIFPKAFQKEAIQNAWDARLNRNEGKDWMLKMYTYKENEQVYFVIEDFGTKGLNAKRWNAFLSLWKPEKEHMDAGGQGQGKFVLMRASNDHILIVESISDETSYKCNYLKDDRKSCEEGNYVKNLISSNIQLLNHQGAKIWIYNVNKDFLDATKSKEFVDSIVESWWQVLGTRFNAKISIFDKVIEIPQLPSPREEKTFLENKLLENFGRIKRLVLCFYDEAIPDIYQGVRVQRANMMVTKIPFEVYEKGYQGRFSGYIEFDEKLEACLKEIEKTDHCGFLFESPWKEIKSLVRDEIDKFVSKIMPPKQSKAINIKNLDKIIQKTNQIINDNCPEILDQGPLMPPIEPKPKLPLRIDYLVVNKKEVKHGDTIRPSCRVINDTTEDRKVLLRIELKREGAKIQEEEYKLKLNAKGQMLIKLSEIKLKQENYPKGKYTIRATIEEDKHDIDTKATSFYLEIKREPIKRGFIKHVSFCDIEIPIRNKPIAKGIIEINLSHYDFTNIWDSFEDKKRQQNQQIGFYIIKICLDEAINELFKLRFKNLGELNLDDLIRETTQLKDKMYHEVYA